MVKNKYGLSIEEKQALLKRFPKMNKEEINKLNAYKVKQQLRQGVKIGIKREQAGIKREKKKAKLLKSETVGYHYDKLVKSARRKEAKKIALQKLKYMQQHPISLQNFESIRKQRISNIMGSRAEQLEIQAVSFNEVPMLRNMEQQRTRAVTPSNNFLIGTEKSVTDSFPD
jgi:hypothetical protein